MNIKTIFLVFAMFITAEQYAWSQQKVAKHPSGPMADLSKINPGQYDGTWWNRTPIRLIQTNMSEIDAQMDVDAYVKSIVDASGNVALINVGGIVANYPTKLPFHYRNTFMKGDLIGELVKRLHAKGIKVIARFDLSKVNEKIAVQKPEWLYLGTNGKPVTENGQVHTCVNGGYQQEYSLEILKEVISNYPVDGIFFNAPGYTTTDYAGKDYGICQCENCKKRFLAMTGLKLPVTAADPGMREYRAFQKTTADDLFKKIESTTKKLNPNLIIISYSEAGVNMIRIESSSSLSNEYEWNYNATDHVKTILGTYKDRMPSNLLQHFLALTYRHISTSPNIERTWVLENMLNGAPLDVYVAGTLLNQEDREFFPIMNDLFRFHKNNEKLFTNLQPASDIALIKGSAQEYRGLIKLLTEEHIMYDIIDPSEIGSDRTPRKLSDYKAVILGDVTGMSDDHIAYLDNYVKNGGKLLVTGFPGKNDGTGKPRSTIALQSLGVMPDYELFPRTFSTYLKLTANDHAAMGQNEFKDIGLVMMYSDMLKLKPLDNTKSYMKLVPATRFGPPEKIYIDDSQITNTPGMFSNTYGKGQSVFIPWLLGTEYYLKGHHAHKALFVAAIKNLLKVDMSLKTDASPLIEMTHLVNRNNAFEWIGMINHTGQVGSSLLQPVTIQNTTVRFKPLKPVTEVRLMRSGKKINFKQANGWITCVVPQLADFEMILYLY